MPKIEIQFTEEERELLREITADSIDKDRYCKKLNETGKYCEKLGNYLCCIKCKERSCLRHLAWKQYRTGIPEFSLLTYASKLADYKKQLRSLKTETQILLELEQELHSLSLLVERDMYAPPLLEIWSRRFSHD